jgi:hypothetical protein
MDKKTICVGVLAPTTGYAVDHAARITLIVREGILRTSYGFETPVIVHDLKLLLQ